MIGLNVQYMLERGGLDVYRAETAMKAKMLWDVIEGSNGYFVNLTDKAYRSRVNCIFRIGCPVNGMPALEKKLKDDAQLARITDLDGHVENPGIRVSMYTGMPVEGVAYLCRFLKRFMRENPIEGIAPLSKM